KSLKGGIWKWHDKGYPIVKTEDSNYPQDDINGKSSEISAEIIKGVPSLDEEYKGEINTTVDARGFSCPVPILKSKKALKKLKIDQVLEILATDPGSQRDIPSWAHATGQELLISEKLSSKDYRFLVKRKK
ncbi:MAG: sulfurtransferase TusA family protein, partial [Candidatus Hodarchaeales archaeon]